MFVQERQDLILEQLHTKGKVLVKELAVRFDVTEDCIRKDLAAMEKGGLLERKYGGAVPPRVNTRQFFIADRKDKFLEEKRVIAAKALELIEDGQMVFLDISTTNMELARQLLNSDKTVTVVTNMAEVMHILSQSDKISMILVGGVYSRDLEGFVGAMANEMLNHFRFDISFMGTVGIDVYTNSVFTYLPEDGYTKKIVVDLSGKSYLMMDTGKLSQAGSFKYASIDAFCGILADEEFDPEITVRLNDYAVDIL